MAGYGGGHPDECVACGSPPWESCGRHPSSPCERLRLRTEHDPISYRYDTFENVNSDYGAIYYVDQTPPRQSWWRRLLARFV